MSTSITNETVIYRRRDLKLVTRCRTVEEFVNQYHDVINEDIVTVAARRAPRLGVRRRFRVCLRDRSTVLSGVGVVDEFIPKDETHGALRLKNLAWDPTSAPVLRRLVRARLAEGSTPNGITVPARPRLELPLPAPTPEIPDVAFARDYTEPDVPAALEDEDDETDEALTLVRSPAEMQALVDELRDEESEVREVRPRRWPLATAALAVASGSAVLAYFVVAVEAMAPATAAATARSAHASPASEKRAAQQVAIEPAAGESTASVRAAPPAPTVRAIEAPTARPIERPRAPAAAPVATTCVATVRSSPPGATIMWNGRTLGKTPLIDQPVDCGDAAIEWRHPRYNPVRATTTLAAGARVSLSKRLQRSYQPITLTSSPANAVFIVNGRFVKGASNVVYAPAQSTVIVRASKRGYRPWTQRVYVSGHGARVHATLRPR